MPSPAIGRGCGQRWRDGMAAYKESLPFYHREAWKRVRALALMRDQGMCVECMRRMEAGYGIRPKRANMVHHKVPVKERPDLALDLDNLESLCWEHHEQRHPERRERKRDGGDAGPAFKMRVIKV